MNLIVGKLKYHIYSNPPCSPTTSIFLQSPFIPLSKGGKRGICDGRIIKLFVKTFFNSLQSSPPYVLLAQNKSTGQASRGEEARRAGEGEIKVRRRSWEGKNILAPKFYLNTFSRFHNFF